MNLPSSRHLAPVLLAVGLMSCSGQPTSPTPAGSDEPADVFLPTYGPMNGLPTALLSGRLVLRDGCIWIASAGGEVLPLWPAGSRIEFEGGRLVVVHGGDRARVGTEVTGGGGEYGPGNYAFVVELIGGEIPERCRGDGFYWLTYNVRSAD